MFKKKLSIAVAYQIVVLIIGFLVCIIVGSYLFLRYHIERSQFVLRRDVQVQLQDEIPNIKRYELDFLGSEDNTNKNE